MNTTLAPNNDIVDQIVILGPILTRYILMVFVSLSLIGNTLNIIVFRSRTLRTSPCSTYLLSASCFNLTWTVCAIIPRVLYTYNLDYSSLNSALCKIRHFTFYATSSLSVWMMVLATLDRFLVSSPSVRYRNMSSLKNAHRFIGIVVFFICTNYFNLFYCANLKGIPPASSCTSITSRECGFYNEISRMLTASILPGFFIFILGMGTVRHLKSLRTAVGVATIQNTHSERRLRKTDRQLIQMLIGQVIIILISWVPHAVQRLYVVITFNEVKAQFRVKIDSVWDQITWIISTLDCSFSFYVYLFTGGILFRRAVRSLFGLRVPDDGFTVLIQTVNIQRNHRLLDHAVLLTENKRSSRNGNSQNVHHMQKN